MDGLSRPERKAYPGINEHGRLAGGPAETAGSPPGQGRQDPRYRPERRSWLGIPLWSDFVLLAPVATIVVAIGAIFSATKSLSPAHRRFWRAASLASGAALLLTSAVLLFRIKAGNIGTRMPREMPGHFDRSVFWMIVVTVAPRSE